MLDVKSVDTEKNLLQFIKNCKFSLENDKRELGEYHYLFDEQVNDSHLRILDKKEILTKKEALAKISDELEVFSTIYNFPILDIKKKEWECFFDNFYEVLFKKGKKDNYYEFLSSYIKNSLSEAILTDKRYFQVDDLLSLSHEFINYGFSKDEILNLCEKLINVQDDNIIYFENYKRR